MSTEITTEVLAKAIDETKDTVHSNNENVRLKIQGKKEDFRIINQTASDGNNQLNAMAIAPIINGKPDYNNVAVVYAGTNTFDDEGHNGFGTAGEAYLGLSGEYDSAEKFLKQTQDKIAEYNGSITDVAGFSQSGGYMMKMAAEHGQVDGFKTTSFDDWGRNQFDTLTPSEQQWLKNNPSMLQRYQNDSWANLSFRDHEYGSLSKIEGIGKHNTLSKYFDGDLLNLDRLADDGIFAPNMTKEQVERASKNWAKANGDWNPFTDDDDEANARVKEYLKIYGTYATKEFSLQMQKLNQLKSVFFASGGGLSSNEKLYLDSEEARIIVQKALSDFQIATENLIKIYQDGIREAQELWQDTLSEARSKGSMLNEGEIRSALEIVGCTKSKIATQPCEKFQGKLDKITTMAENFSNLTSEIQAKINEILQRDSELAQQIKES